MTNIILHCSMYANQMGFSLEIGDEVTDEMRNNQTFQSLLFDNHIEIGTPDDLLALAAFKMYKESVRSQPKRVTEKDIFLAAWRICSENNISQSNLTPVSENSGGGSYVVFEHSQEQDGLVQLSVTLPTIESARQYVNAWKSKRLSIYLLVK